MGVSAMLPSNDGAMNDLLSVYQEYRGENEI